MEFEPLKHTKEFLLTNPEILFKLAESSESFALSHLASDFEILSYCDLPSLSSIGDKSVAHVLAKHQEIWLENSAVKNKNVLKIADSQGRTVAHELAKFQKSWHTHELAFDKEILSLCEENGEDAYLEGRVSTTLAKSQSDWIKSLNLDHKEILLAPSGSDQSYTLLRWLYENSRMSLLPDVFLSDEEVMNTSVHDKSFSLALIFSGEIDINRQALIWSNSELTQNPDLLKKFEGTIAFGLARSKKSNWINTPIAKNHEILSLTYNLGYTIAHRIILTHKENTPRFLWDKAYSDIVTNHELNKGLTLYHLLAKHSEDWCNQAPEAFNKTLLNKRYQLKNNSGVYEDVSLAECMVSLPLKEQVLRIVRLGDAFRISAVENGRGFYNDTLLDINTADEIYESINLLLEEECDQIIEAKICLAAYATYRHFLVAEKKPKRIRIDDEEQKNREDKWTFYLNKFQNRFESLVENNPDYVLSVSVIDESEMSPGLELISKIKAKFEFSKITSNDAETINWEINKNLNNLY